MGSEEIMAALYTDMYWQSRAERAEAEHDELRGAYEDLMERLCVAFDCPNPNAIVEHIQALLEMAQERERAAVADNAALREALEGLSVWTERWASGHIVSRQMLAALERSRQALAADHPGAALAAALDAWCEARRRTDAAKTRSSYSFAVQEEGRRAEALEKAWRGKSDAE